MRYKETFNGRVISLTLPFFYIEKERGMATNKMELQEAILKAVDAVVTQRNNDLKLDKTITAIVKKNVGVRYGKPVYQGPDPHGPGRHGGLRRLAL